MGGAPSAHVAFHAAMRATAGAAHSGLARRARSCELGRGGDAFKKGCRWGQRPRCARRRQAATCGPPAYRVLLTADFPCLPLTPASAGPLTFPLSSSLLNPRYPFPYPNASLRSLTSPLSPPIPHPVGVTPMLAASAARWVALAIPPDSPTLGRSLAALAARAAAVSPSSANLSGTAAGGAVSRGGEQPSVPCGPAADLAVSTTTPTSPLVRVVRDSCRGGGGGQAFTPPPPRGWRGAGHWSGAVTGPPPRARRGLATSPISDELDRTEVSSSVPPEAVRTKSSGARRPPYHWVDEEAQRLISRAYARHATLGDRTDGGTRSFPPALAVADLESLGGSGLAASYPVTTVTDRLARTLVRGGAAAVHWFFGNRYGHHAVTLETVAAVPGMVAAFHRHFRSLRRMERDRGHIPVLTEEAENEKFHLLIWLKVTTPTRLERALVVAAQAVYVTFYSAAYALAPTFAHRLTGYLEEVAVQAYTDYLRAIDRGDIPNGPAPEIAKLYYRLPADATIRDVVLHVRADECMVRDVT